MWAHSHSGKQGVCCEGWTCLCYSLPKSHTLMLDDSKPQQIFPQKMWALHIAILKMEGKSGKSYKIGCLLKNKENPKYSADGQYRSANNGPKLAFSVKRSAEVLCHLIWKFSHAQILIQGYKGRFTHYIKLFPLWIADVLMYESLH